MRDNCVQFSICKRGSGRERSPQAWDCRLLVLQWTLSKQWVFETLGPQWNRDSWWSQFGALQVAWDIVLWSSFNRQTYMCVYGSSLVSGTYLECWLTELMEGRGEGRDDKPVGSVGACQSHCLLVLLRCSKSEGLFRNGVGTVQRLGDSHAFGMWNVAWVKKKGKEWK